MRLTTPVTTPVTAPTNSRAAMENAFGTSRTQPDKEDITLELVNMKVDKAATGNLSEKVTFSIENLLIRFINTIIIFINPIIIHIWAQFEVDIYYMLNYGSNLSILMFVQAIAGRVSGYDRFSSQAQMREMMTARGGVDTRTDFIGSRLAQLKGQKQTPKQALQTLVES